ncbi:MAG TPA: hypothetical protein VFP68_09880, partial [Burkholderiaceae bacterium]|nr:hypothetical protein [Burkholderiaceae bacterium]
MRNEPASGASPVNDIDPLSDTDVSHVVSTAAQALALLRPQHETDPQRVRNLLDQKLRAYNTPGRSATMDRQNKDLCAMLENLPSDKLDEVAHRYLQLVKDPRRALFGPSSSSAAPEASATEHDSEPSTPSTRSSEEIVVVDSTPPNDSPDQTSRQHAQAIARDLMTFLPEATDRRSLDNLFKQCHKSPALAARPLFSTFESRSQRSDRQLRERLRAIPEDLRQDVMDACMKMQDEALAREITKLLPGTSDRSAVLKLLEQRRKKPALAARPLMESRSERSARHLRERLRALSHDRLEALVDACVEMSRDVQSERDRDL